MKRTFLILTVAALFALNLSAKPYVQFNQNEVLVQKEGKYSLNFGKAFESVDNLFAHAREYPLDFDNDADKNAARTDLQKLLGLFDGMEKQGMRAALENEGKFYFDLARARLFVCAHNFDAPDAAAKANAAYERLLASYEKELGELASSRLNIEFGTYLANSGQSELAKKQLEAALQKGNENARYSLAIVYLWLNEPKKAQDELEIYLKIHPNNKSASQILEAIKSGDIKFQSTNGR